MSRVGRTRLYERSDPTVKIRLPAEVYRKLRTQAAENGRTIAGQIRYIVLQHFERLEVIER